MSDEVLDEFDESYDEMCETIDSMIREDAKLQAYLKITKSRRKPFPKHLRNMLAKVHSRQ